MQVSALDPSIRQYHLYRDMRTYGKFELLYTEARKAGSVYLQVRRRRAAGRAARAEADGG